MKNISIYLNIILSAAIVYLLWPHESHYKENNRIIDSLTNVNAKLDVINASLDDSIKFYKSKALLNLSKADQEQKVKYIYKIKYEKDTAYYHSISSLQRDSIIRTIFLKK